jgi:hypothetical protein
MAGATDGIRAHDILLSYAPLSKHGYCWYYVWQAYAAAGAWTSMGSTPTALAAWNVTSGRHPGDWNPPHGAAIWLGRRYSDGNDSGDVFIAGAYDGDHAATDYPGWGQTGRVSIQGRINQTGREYLGWSDHVLDCPITSAIAPEPPKPDPPTWKEGNMFIIHNATSPDQKVLVTVDAGQIRCYYLEDPYERAVFLAVSPSIPVAPCDDPTFDGFLQRAGYVYGAPVPLIDVNAANVDEGPGRGHGK